MAYINIDVEDFIDEISTEDLRAELQSRNVLCDTPDARRLAQDLRGAFYKRDASRFEALLTAHLDPIEIKQKVTA